MSELLLVVKVIFFVFFFSFVRIDKLHLTLELFEILEIQFILGLGSGMLFVEGSLLVFTNFFPLLAGM